ncbi:MAG: PDZ domain-containing protein [Clostridium sp.]|nr:PDZ domain-containing protein [Clostridium sp.]
MQGYKKLLKGLLACNIAFVIIVAGIGYQKEKGANDIAEVLNNLNATSTAANNATAGKVAKKVIPVGKTVGIYVNTNGILVIDTGEVTDMNGQTYTPAKNKLMPGDYITKLNGEKVRSKKQLITDITECNGDALVFSVERNGQQTDVSVEPVETELNMYKVGIWVRDDLQGLGTITYVDGTQFGALGHSINDADTGEMLDVSGGQLYEADIFGVERGKAGNPGVIEGVISYDTENVVGNVNKNTLYGIFGQITDDFAMSVSQKEAMEIADPDEVERGTAYIQSYVSGEKETYEIEIVNIHPNEHGDAEMEICVTDEDLIGQTGGIIQGMSGSPIIQNGKLVGAVTHVFVEDPTRGYGIFVEEMMQK